MSGRKSCEVVDLLKRGEAIRDERLRQDMDIINADIHEVAGFDDRIAAAKSKADGLDLGADNLSRKEFGDEVTALEGRWSQAAARVASPGGRAKAEREKAKAEAAGSGIHDADSTAQRLRRAVAGKSHYCDSEYAQAMSLVEVYKAHVATVAAAAGAIQKTKRKSQAEAIESENALSELEVLRQQMAGLKKRAAEIDALRREAGRLRSTLQEDFNAIPSVDAEKFAAGPWKALRKRLDSFLSEADEAVVRNCAEMFTAIGALKSDVAAQRQRHEERRSKIQGHRDTIESELKGLSYGDPDAYLVGKTGNLGLFDYQERHGSGSVREQFQTKWKTAENAFRSEDFGTAEKLLPELDALLADADASVRRLNEDQLKAAGMAKDIREVIKRLKYRSIKTGGDSHNGYTIEARAGDEVLNFDTIAFIDGEPVVKIDHKESVSGTCHTSMAKLAQAMTDEGVPVSDIVKDGESIFDGRKVVGKAKNRKTTAVIKGGAQ